MTPGRTIQAHPTDLPPAVAAALAMPDPGPGEPSTTLAAGIPFASIAWGDPGARPLVLLHGVTASSRIWWRVGPALAAAGHRVTAPDLPGHGLTGHWTGHHRFRDNAADVAAWIRAAGLDVPGLQVVGHSWGGMTAAALPLAGIRPATLVLLDPPTVPHAVISMMASDPSERPYPDLESAVAGLAAANPTWPAARCRGQGGRADPTRRQRGARHPARQRRLGRRPRRPVRTGGRGPRHLAGQGRPGGRRVRPRRGAPRVRGEDRRGPRADPGGRAARPATDAPGGDDRGPPRGARWTGRWLS